MTTEHRRSSSLELIASLVFLLSLVVAFILGGGQKLEDRQDIILTLLPSTDEVVPLLDDLYQVEVQQENGPEDYFVAFASGNGYGGPLAVVVVIDADGTIHQQEIISQQETHSYFAKVSKNNFSEQFQGIEPDVDFIFATNIDAVTGATETCRAITEATEKARHLALTAGLGLERAELPGPSIRLGLREIAVVLLFAMGVLIVTAKLPFKRQLRWATMIAAIIFLGFTFDGSVNIAKISSFLLGNVGDWRLELFWILLFGGLLVSIVFLDKNPYCHCYCPFGSAQECIGAIGNARVIADRGLRRLGTWLKRLLVWFTLLLAIYFRNASLAGYEIFGGLFSFTATTVQFILLATILVASLIIKRPWCTFLCPIDPVVDFLRGARNLCVGLFKGDVKA
jgi:NosR/NirI family nitrous oxide reductase transcriptional regulator